MSMRYLGGFISASYNPLKVPNAPTIGTVTAGNAQVSVTFTAPSNVGGSAITSYIVLVRDSSSGATFTNTGSASPIVVTGLTNGNTYTAQVAAVNSYGPSAYSASSGSFVPVLSYKLFSWGSDGAGRLGLNTLNISRSSPVQVGALTTWLSVVSNTNSGLGLQSNNSIWSWGDNAQGQLGLNDTTYRLSPVQVGALTSWAKISKGDSTGAAIKTDGTLWVWGLNNIGQLGQNNTVSRSSPVQIGTDTNWSAVAPASSFATALKTDGTILAWGTNYSGQLGQNNRVYRSSPVQIGADTNWAKISSGPDCSAAIKTTGTLWLWGGNNYGQLGLNDRVARSSPVQVGALTDWTSINVQRYFAIALRSNGTIWVWGQNNFGQLGQNNLINRSSPTQVGALTTWSSICIGNGTDVNSAAIKTDGTLWVWGNNSSGQLGQNNRTYRSSPVQVGALTTWASISAGGSFMLALSS